MSAQDRATQRWEEHRHLTAIKELQGRVIDGTYPGGQLQAAMQLSLVEVPWLLAEIGRLKQELGKNILTVVGVGL